MPPNHFPNIFDHSLYCLQIREIALHHTFLSWYADQIALLLDEPARSLFGPRIESKPIYTRISKREH